MPCLDEPYNNYQLVGYFRGGGMVFSVCRNRRVELLRFCGVIALLLGVLFQSIPVHAATTAQIDAARLAAVRWAIENQNGNGSWSGAGAGVLTDTSAVVDGLRHAGVYGFPYSRGIAWLLNAESVSMDGLSRQVTALNSAGANTTAGMQRLLVARNERALAWGTYAQYGASFPDTALVLDAIRDTGTPYADTGTTLGFVISSQNADGGWSYAPNTIASSQSRILPTALTLITLIKYRNDGWGIQSFVTAGINWLVTQQKGDGSFGDDSAGTVVETALSYLAIGAELGSGHTAAVAAQDFLIAQQAGNGSWNTDAFQTALALQTLPAAALADSDNDGVPDEVETLIGTDPLLADSRYLAGGNGNGVAGVTLPTDVSSAAVGDAYSHNLADTGGTGPFTWTIVVGALPAGVSLDSATGLLSGSPTEAGTFSFIYEVTDSAQQTVRLVSQIIVAAPAFAADGDLNGDGAVNGADVLLALRIVTGDLMPSAEQRVRGDVAPLVAGSPAPDAQINAGDVLVIQRKALGEISF
jgi:hypothetical protein